MAEVEVAAVREGLEAPLPEVVDAILDNCRHHSHRLLHAMALESRQEPASEDSVFGTNRMVLNASYLVEEAQTEVFRSALEHLATRFERLGLVYYIGGPHPPCHFAPEEAPTL